MKMGGRMSSREVGTRQVWGHSLRGGNHGMGVQALQNRVSFRERYKGSWGV